MIEYRDPITFPVFVSVSTHWKYRSGSSGRRANHLIKLSDLEHPFVQAPNFSFSFSRIPDTGIYLLTYDSSELLLCS